MMHLYDFHETLQPRLPRVDHWSLQTVIVQE